MSVTYNYSGKLVLVTGSTAGIGKVIAEQYVKYGANVIINSRKQESVDKVVNELTTKYINPEASDETKDKDNDSCTQNIYGFASDLSKSEDCNKLIAFVFQTGHLDILVNNIGIFASKPFAQITDDEWTNIFNVNVMSMVRMCRAFLPKMLETDDITKKPKGGNIITISSECGVRSLATMMHYSMTKAAQLNVSRGLAELTKGISGVRVNALLPGPTWTPGVEQYMKGFAKDNGYGDDVDTAIKDYFKEHEPDSLRQNFLDPLEVANACLYVSSDAASATNGAAFKVEGGIVKVNNKLRIDIDKY
eukprot:118326_1